MALIGSLSINMSVSTAALVKGLKVASGQLKTFGLGASKAFTEVGGSMLMAGSAAWKIGSTISSAIGKVAVGAFVALKDTIGFVIDGIAEMAKKTLLFGTILGGIALYAVWDVVKGGVALSEQYDRATIVFGKFAGMVKDEADKMAVAFGVSRKEFVRSASAFGTIFEGAKYTQEDAAKLSIHFTKLATDLSSLAHIPVEEALAKIQSGLAGQVRPLREVGIFMSEAEIDAYAYKNGITKLNAELTESQKIQARIGFITQAAAIANNNLAETANGAGNSIRGLMGRFENLKDEIGLTLLKLLLPAFQEVNVLLQAITMQFEAMGFASKASTAGILGGAAAEVTSIGLVQRGIMWAADAWQTFKIEALNAIIAISTSLIKMIESVGSARGALAGITGALGLGGQTRQLNEGIDAVAASLNRAKDAMAKLRDEQMGAPKASIAIADAFDKARQSIEAARTDLKNTPQLNVADLKPGGAAAAAKPIGAPKFASAMVEGSKEATNAILRSKYGTQLTATNDPARQTAANTKKQVDLLQVIANKIGGAAEAKAMEIGAAFGPALVGNF